MPGNKDAYSPSIEGLSRFSDTAIGEATGGGVLVAAALAESRDKPFAWAAGFFFGNSELRLAPWNVIAGISGFDD